MTGVAHAVLASSAENRTTYSLTVGTNGVNNSGFTTGGGAFGSLTPTTYRQFNVITVRSINTGGGVDFQFAVDTSIGWTATSVDRIQVVDGTGATRIYRAAQGSIGGAGITWGDGSNAVYLPAHSGQVRPVIIYWKI